MAAIKKQLFIRESWVDELNVYYTKDEILTSMNGDSADAGEKVYVYELKEVLTYKTDLVPEKAKK